MGQDGADCIIMTKTEKFAKNPSLDVVPSARIDNLARSKYDVAIAAALSGNHGLLRMIVRLCRWVG